MLKHLRKLNKQPERDQEPDEGATLPERASLDEDIIILSDLHLGEACKDIPRIDYLKAGDIFDRHISSFLQYKTGQAASGRPMRLILGGTFSTSCRSPSRLPTLQNPPAHMASGTPKMSQPGNS